MQSYENKLAKKKYLASEKGKITTTKYRNRPDIKEKQRQYQIEYLKNPENKLKIKDYYKEYAKTDKSKKQRKQYSNSHRIERSLRSRLNTALKHNYKTGSAVRDLGCSVEQFKKYLENKFYHNPKTGEHMTWNNYGLYGWHIDHILPLSSFNLKDRNQLLKACHYRNLQPLWAEENLSKGNRS